MLSVPLLIGVIASGPAWIHLLLAAFWFVGYFAFFALGQWLKSHLKKRWFPPVRAYALATLPLGIGVLALRPGLAIWAPAFVPLVAISLGCSYRRKDRSLLNDAVTIIAACLMLVVAFDAGGGVLWPRAWVGAAIVWIYFFGTVWYVKTIIRERENPAYTWGSMIHHGAAILAAPGLIFLVTGIWSWTTTALFAALAARAALVPRTRATPIQTGIGEIVASVIITMLVLTEVF